MSHRQILLVTLTVCALVSGDGGRKGSGSHESAEMSGEDEYPGQKHNTIKAGHQHKFWIPTYEGTNPLNRRKISITTSEIEKYDTSVDMSLSGFNKNRTRSTTTLYNNNNASSMPMLWSGNDFSLNKTDIEFNSLNSDETLLEPELETSGESFSSGSKPNLKCFLATTAISILMMKTTTKDQNSTPDTRITIKNTYKSKTTATTAKLSSGPKYIQQIKKDFIKYLKKSQAPKNKYVEKEITSNFFTALSKVKSKETSINTREYYKQLVKSATENTKKKLGYSKIDMLTTNQPQPPAEIIAINIDSKSLEKPHPVEEINFITQHDPFSGKQRMQYNNKIKKSNLKLSKGQKLNKSKYFQYDYKTVQNNTDWGISTGEEINQSKPSSQSSRADDFIESVQERKTEKTRPTWSDKMFHNKTGRKSNQRNLIKGDLSSQFETSPELKRWSGKKLQDKAEKLRAKEGKLSRKSKRKRAIKKRITGERKDKRKTYQEQEQDSYTEKKLRMRTKGEKQHAIKEVKSYLKGMHEGRPRDTYHKIKQFSDNIGNEYRERGRRKGRDYGYKRKVLRDQSNWGVRSKKRAGQRRDDGTESGRWDKRAEQRVNSRRDGSYYHKGGMRGDTVDQRYSKGRGRGGGKGSFRNTRGAYRGNRRDDRRGERGRNSVRKRGGKDRRSGKRKS